MISTGRSKKGRNASLRLGGEQLVKMLECFTMAGRPDSEKREVFTMRDLDELRYNLAHLSVDAVRRFYERAHGDCRMIYDRLPSPKQMQTLVQVWKQLWKWR